MPPSDGLAMPSAFDLIGHNPALQEHWIRRFIAFVIDAVIVAVVGLFVAIPLSFPFLGWAWWFSGIFWGGMWFIYSVLLETLFGGTVGKKIVALRVVAIDRNLDVVHTVVRNLPKIFPLIVLVDVLVGAAQQGDPRQRLFDRTARTPVSRLDQCPYMDGQGRMTQHAGPHAMLIHAPPSPLSPPTTP